MVRQGYLTAETDWTNTIPAASANAYNEATAAIPAPFDPSYLSGQIDNKLDSAIYAEDSGKFLTAHQDLSNYATTASVAEKLDTTAFSNVSGDFLTAVDLTPYQTTAGMTAYQPVGDYASATDLANYQPVSSMTAYQPTGNYLTTADSANFYTTANESGFITGIPAGTMNESAFGYDANYKISGYNGSAFAGGSDVPEGVMVESGLEYNAVNEISGYNGSAIAQYGAEKQWLVHDDTIVHVANSAQYAFGCNISALQRLMGIDETVLYSGNIGNIGGQIVFAEPFSAFNKIKVRAGVDNPYTTEYDTTLLKYTTRIALKIGWSFNYNQEMFLKFIPYDLSINSFTYTGNTLIQTTHSNTNINVILNDSTYLKPSAEFVVVGIGRKEV